MIGKNSVHAALTGLSLLVAGVAAGQSGRPVNPYSDQDQALAAEMRKVEQEGQRLQQAANRYGQMAEEFRTKSQNLNQRVENHNRQKPSSRDRYAVERYNEEARRLNREKSALQQEGQRLEQYRTRLLEDYRQYQAAVRRLQAPRHADPAPRSNQVQAPAPRGTPVSPPPAAGPSSTSNAGNLGNRGYGYDENAKKSLSPGGQSRPRLDAPPARPSSSGNSQSGSARPTSPNAAPGNRGYGYDENAKKSLSPGGVSQRPSAPMGPTGSQSGPAKPMSSVTAPARPPAASSATRPTQAVPGSQSQSAAAQSQVQGGNGTQKPSNTAASPGGSAGRPPVRSTFQVTWHKYRVTDGVTTMVESGQNGPYTSRQEAQSRVNKLNSTDWREGKIRYYYSARVVER